MIGIEIERAIKILSKLPGLGPRSARRVVLFIIKKRELLLAPLIAALQGLEESIAVCPICGNYDSTSPCSICQEEKRKNGIVCVVHDVADLWALERTGVFKGRYHVLGGLLSALDGIGPSDIGIKKLLERVKDEALSEIILALPATVDGQTTAHYIAENIKEPNVEVSGLAHGVPIGGELDYLDDGTLQAAIKARRPF